jgi:hypothetical protein
VSFSWSRVATWLVALVVGAMYGAACTVAHAFLWGWFPLGLILAIIGTAAMLAAVRLLTGDRWTALSAGLGMMAAALVLSGTGPGGSVVVPAALPGDPPLGIIWTVALPILVAVAVSWPDTSRIRPPAGN